MEYYTFEQLKEMAFKDGITGNKVAVGIWAKMNGFLKKKTSVELHSTLNWMIGNLIMYDCQSLSVRQHQK